MTDTTTIAEELEALAADYRHILEERRREGREGRWDRRQRAVADTLLDRFERLLEQWVDTPRARMQWRAHLHTGSPPPEGEEVEAPLCYAGVSPTGSRFEVRPTARGEYGLYLDGGLVERRKRWERDDRTVRTPVTFGDHLFEERFDVPPDAVEALRTFLGAEGEPPPWPHAATLFEQGIVDEHFCLTPRGRRFVDTNPGGPPSSALPRRWSPESPR